MGGCVFPVTQGCLKIRDSVQKAPSIRGASTECPPAPPVLSNSPKWPPQVLGALQKLLQHSQTTEASGQMTPLLLVLVQFHPFPLKGQNFLPLLFTKSSQSVAPLFSNVEILVL